MMIWETCLTIFKSTLCRFQWPSMPFMRELDLRFNRNLDPASMTGGEVSPKTMGTLLCLADENHCSNRKSSWHMNKNAQKYGGT